MEDALNVKHRSSMGMIGEEKEEISFLDDGAFYFFPFFSGAADMYE